MRNILWRGGVDKASMITVVVIITTAFLIGNALTQDATAILFFLSMMVVLTFLKRPYLFLSILILFSINIFGVVRLVDLPHLKTPGFGTFQVQDGLLAIVVLIMLTVLISKRSVLHEIFRSKLAVPIIGLLLLNVLGLIQGYYYSGNLHYAFNRSRNMSFYLIFFFTLFAIRTPKDLRVFFKICVIFSVICSIVILWQVYNGESFISVGVSKTIYMREFGLYRSYQYSIFFISAVFFCVISVILGRHNKKNSLWLSVIAILIAIALLLTFARNIWGGTILGLLFIVWHQSRRRHAKAILAIVLISMVFLILSSTFISHIADVSMSRIISERINQSQEDILYGGGGSSFSVRTEGLMNRVRMLVDRKLLFGYGYKASDAPNYFIARLDLTIAEADNMWALIISYFGLSGLILFIWLIIAAVKELRSSLRVVPRSLEKSILFGLGGFYIQQMLVSYFSSNLFSYTSVGTISCSLALVYLIRRFHEKGIGGQYVR